jgi:hypothetical protein
MRIEGLVVKTCGLAERAHDAREVVIIFLSNVLIDDLKTSRYPGFDIHVTAHDKCSDRLNGSCSDRHPSTIRCSLADGAAAAQCLDVFRPRGRPIDLRIFDRHPLASVGTLVLGLRCSCCPGSAPMPRLLGIYALPQARRLGAAL